MGIGNVSLGSPSLIKGVKSPTASYNLFGVNNKLLSTVIVERASKALNAPVLLLLFLKNVLLNRKANVWACFQVSADILDSTEATDAMMRAFISELDLLISI